MSDAMGPLTFGKKEEQIFLGREIAQHQDYSEETAVKIDEEVRRIVNQNYQRAENHLAEHKASLLTIAEALLTTRCSTRSRSGGSPPGSRSTRSARPTPAHRPRPPTMTRPVPVARAAGGRSPMAPLQKPLPQE